MFVPNAGVGLSQSAVPPPKFSEQFTPPSADSVPFNDTPQANDTQQIATADNTPVTIPDEPSGEQAQQFNYTLGKKISTEAPRKVQENSESSTNEGPNPDASSVNNIEQPLLAQIAQKSAISDLITDNQPAIQETVKPVAGRQLAGMLVESNTEQLPYVAGQAVKTINNNSILTTQQAKPALETASPDSSSGEFVANIQSFNAAGSPENAQITSNGIIITAANPADGENGGESTLEIPTGNGKAADGELTPELLAGNDKAADGELTPEVLTVSGKAADGELTPEILAALGKNTDGQQPVTNDSPNTTTQTNIFSLQSEQPVPEASSGDKAAVTGENIIMPDKPVITDGQQTSVSQQVIGVNPQPQTNSAAVNPQLANNDASTTNNNTESGLNSQITTELSDSNAKDSQSTGDSSSGQFLLKDLNPQQVNITTGQTKETTDSDSNFEQTISVNNIQADIAEQASNPTLAQGTDGNPDIITDISEQIQSAVLQTSSLRDEKQITIQLNPPELGKVNIKFEQQADKITGLLEVDKPQTRIELQQALPQIVRNLNDAGIMVKRLEVTLTGEQQQQALKDQSLTSGQQDFSGQQNSANPGTQGDNEPYYEWMAGNLEDGYTGFAQPQEMLVTGSSINMLA